MLDVSIRVSLLKMLSLFRHELGMTYIFITHDLAVARYFAWDGRIAVMYLGRVVEIGPTPCLIHHPQHPYTKALLSAIPEADPVATRNRERVPLRSMDVPSLVNLPKGCAFHPRCPLFVPGLCDVEVPQLIEITVNDTPTTVGAIREPMGAVGAIHESPLRDTCATLQIACHVVAAQQKRNGDAPRSREELERIYSGKGSAPQ
jgi:peptide/nickel transport system ATP-binding protein